MTSWTSFNVYSFFQCVKSDTLSCRSPGRPPCAADSSSAGPRWRDSLDCLARGHLNLLWLTY